MGSRVELWIILACLLVLAGVYGKSRWDDRSKLVTARTELRTQQNAATDVDRATVQKLRHDAAVDIVVGKSRTKSRELETNDPSYRDYLDRPLPDGALRMYHDAAQGFAESARAAGADPGRK